MKKVVTKKKVGAVKSGTYTATIKLFGKKYEATGVTAKDAINNLKVQNGKGRGILTISNGKQVKERILMPMAVFRLFNTYGFSREVALKNVSLLFDL